MLLRTKSTMNHHVESALSIEFCTSDIKSRIIVFIYF